MLAALPAALLRAMFGWFGKPFAPLLTPDQLLLVGGTFAFAGGRLFSAVFTAFCTATAIAFAAALLKNNVCTKLMVVFSLLKVTGFIVYSVPYTECHPTCNAFHAF